MLQACDRLCSSKWNYAYSPSNQSLPSTARLWLHCVRWQHGDVLNSSNWCCVIALWTVRSIEVTSESDNDSPVIDSPIENRYRLVVELSLSYGWRSVDQFVLVAGSHLGPMTRFYPYPLFSDNCFVHLPVGRPLWREDGSVTYSAISEDQ
jgi:hypothetical protein